jgi:hypothetical protein
MNTTGCPLHKGMSASPATVQASVSMYSIDRATGTLTLIGTIGT